VTGVGFVALMCIVSALILVCWKKHYRIYKVCQIPVSTICTTQLFFFPFEEKVTIAGFSSILFVTQYLIFSIVGYLLWFRTIIISVFTARCDA